MKRRERHAGLTEAGADMMRTEIQETLERIPEASKYIFVDTENVGSSWLDLIEDIASEQAVYEDEQGSYRLDSYPYEVLDPQFILLYTDNTPYMSFDDCIRFSEYRHLVITIKCNPGSKAASALDFQLVSIIGYMINRYPSAEYCIMSKDKGYDPMVKFWSDAGYSVCRKEPTKLSKSSEVESKVENNVQIDAPTEADKVLTEEEKKKKRDEFVASLLPGKNKKVRNQVKTIMSAKDSKEKKNNVYHAVIKQFGQKEGLEIYRAIRDHLEEYKQYK